MNELQEKTEGQLLSESFGLSVPQNAAQVRPLAVIEAELDVLERDTRQKEVALIENYIEVGRRLEEVKAQLPHGEWGPWLESRGYAQAKAVKLMRVFRAYGKEQLSLFGSEAKSQAFTNLGFHKLVQLLAIEDEGERERFVAEHDVEGMSTRELDRVLKEREKAQEEAEAARAEANRLQEQLSDQAKVYEAKLTGADVETVHAKREAREAREELEKQREKARRLQDALSEANSSAQAAEEEHTRLLRELEDLRNRPAQADTEAVEDARRAAIDEMTEKVDKAKEARKKAEEKRKAAEASLEAVQKELAELKAKGPEVRELTQEEKDALVAGAVAQARADSEERVQTLEKQLAQADTNTAEFKVRFTYWQEEYLKMMEPLERIARTDAEKAAKLRLGIQAALEQMRQKNEGH